MNSILRRPKGFTIVEITVVIGVIGLLVALVAVAYRGAQENARSSRASSELLTLSKAIITARANTNKTLMQITGNGCTACGNQANYNASLDAIGAAAGTNLNGLKTGDPWGNNYVLDENEGEFVGDPCRVDGLSISGSHPDVVVPTIPMFTC